MRTSRFSHSLRAPIALAIIAVAMLVSGCGFNLDQRGVIQKNVSQTDLANGNEPYFNVDGLTMQVQSSRALNAYSNDVTYFAGVKYAQSIPSDDFWYGVFLWAKNQNKTPIDSPSINDFVLTDSVGNSYAPVKLDPNVNPWVWTSMPLAHNEIEPADDTIAGEGPAGGGLLLFELPYAVYQDRPLTLHVYSRNGSHSRGSASSISLDF